MVIPRGTWTEKGWWVKATPDGAPYPLGSGLGPKFQEAGVCTIPDALKYGVNLFHSKACMGTRQVLSRTRENTSGKIMEKLQLGEYIWRSYDDILEEATAIGWGIRAKGFNPFDRIAIFAETRPEWFTAAVGCLQHRITVCTLYTTLTDGGLIHALNDTEVQLILTSFDLLSRVLRLLPQCPKIKTVVVMEDQLEGIGKKLEVPSGVTVVPFQSIKVNKKTRETKLAPTAEAEDTAIIMYTSGSTGTPKGVELSHTNILTSVIAYSVQMKIGTSDRYLAYLPLAHIMELATEVALVSLGVQILYSSFLTLTNNSPKVMKGSEGDARVARPTVMNAVPLVMDRIVKSVSQTVEKQGRVKSWIFGLVLKCKFWLDCIPFVSKVLDLLIFGKIKGEFGGDLKRLVVGGAPLSPQTHNIIRAIFGTHIQVGYGSTETASCITGMDEDDIITGHVGGPNLGVLLRLSDWKEGGYLTTDYPRPRGEVLVGGPIVAKGYFRLPEETEAAFFEEDGIRWFRTADIGELKEDGSIRIIDRMKDLIKLKHGEYVSLSNAESKIKTLSIVENICVFADSTQDKTVAVVVPSADRLLVLAQALGIKDAISSAEKLCKNAHVKEAILRDIQSHGKRCGLTKWEIPADIFLTHEVWTPDSGMVTAALKLRRKQLGQQYRSMVHDMYSRLGSQEL